MITAVCGGKGGVGTSTVAYELGAALDAMVVDADLGMADLPRGRGPDLHDVLAGRADPCEAVRGGPVALLPCGRTLAGARAADPTALGDALDAVARDHGQVVVDCPSGTRADVGLSLHAADASVLVTTPDAAALGDALLVRELARELDAGLVRVVCNRVRDVEDPVPAVERAVGAPRCVVPESDELGETLATGDPVVSRAPSGEAARAIHRLADAVHSVSSW